MVSWWGGVTLKQKNSLYSNLYYTLHLYGHAIRRKSSYNVRWPAHRRSCGFKYSLEECVHLRYLKNYTKVSYAARREVGEEKRSWDFYVTFEINLIHDFFNNEQRGPRLCFFHLLYPFKFRSIFFYKKYFTGAVPFVKTCPYLSNSVVIHFIIQGVPLT